MGGRGPAVTLLALVIAAAALPAAEAGHSDEIRPGDPLVGADCTLGYIFDGADGHVYAATAAHCVQETQTVHTHLNHGFGEVVLDSQNLDRMDAALIRVHADEEAHVHATVRGHPGTPTKVATPEDTRPGNLLWISGFGTATQQTSTTREQRLGALASHNETTYRAEGAVTFGDSGGPVVHDATGAALGLVSRLDRSPPPANLVGPTVQGALAFYEANGYDLTLRTAPQDYPGGLIPSFQEP